MDVARALPTARPGVASELPARAVGRMLAHGIVGWALCAVTMGGLLHIARTEVAVAVHAVVAPLIFTAVAVHYFRKRGSREPLPTALAWTATVAVLDTILAGAVLGSFAMFRSVAGTWLPFGLIFLAAWTTGALMSTMPWPKPSHTSEGAR
jgi:hypothetical protein